jgi:hypothetical protein
MSTAVNLRPRLLISRGFNATRRFSVCVSRLHADSAAAIADSFLSRFQSLGPQTRTQTLDANQLQLLGLTLNRPTLFPGSPSLSNPPAPPPDTPVPPGYHLVYFTPAFLESELGADGTDASYNPEAPFTRRMWAGGEVLWPRGADGKPNPLRVGQRVSETTRVLSAESKVVKKTGEDMIVVGVEKEFANEQGVSIVDRRSVTVTPGLQLALNKILTEIQELGFPQSSTYTNCFVPVQRPVLLIGVPPGSSESYVDHLRREHTHSHPGANVRYALSILRPDIQPSQNPLLSPLGT